VLRYIDERCAYKLGTANTKRKLFRERFLWSLETNWVAFNMKEKNCNVEMSFSSLVSAGFEIDAAARQEVWTVPTSRCSRKNFEKAF
jgi:hypothetical protein